MEKLYHGACFYPELWDWETVKSDICKMKETGINIVRIGEFWWGKLEPEKGKVDTGFVKKVMDLLYENGLEVILCTPTPTPPVWMTHGNEKILHVDCEGKRMMHGARQHVCTNNREFRDSCTDIVEKIAAAVGRHPALKLWQLDNEFKCHISECFCESCRKQWNQWLEKKYGSIGNLNEKWGTMIWSQSYQSFEQVPQPLKRTPFLHNPSLSTNYGMFHREKLAEFAKEQAEAIRKYSEVPVTTNSGIFFSVDNEMLFENLDCVGFDTYAPSKIFERFVMNCDIWRGLKLGKGYWLLETSSSHAGAVETHAEVHPKGYLAAEAALLYSLGGKSFNYWLWRQQAFGCEQNHSAVLSAWGAPGVGYEDVIQVGEVKKELEDFILSTKLCKGEVAVTYSDRAKLFMTTETHGQDNYLELFTGLYRILLKTGVHRELIPEGESLEGYKLLFSPLMYNLSEEYIERAAQFVEKGGIWIVGPLSGSKTSEHGIHRDAALGKRLEELAGIETLYTYPMENSGGEGKAFGEKAPLKLWSAVFKCKEAKAVGVLEKGITQGESFITENSYGKGKIVMIGSLPYGESGNEMLKKLFEYYIKVSGIKSPKVSEGIVMVPRYKGEEYYEIYINMKEDKGKVENLKIEIPSFGYKIVKKDISM